MKAKYLIGILAVSALAFGACKKNNGCSRSEKAVVKDFSDSDTCGIVFQLEDGSKLEPTNLAEFAGLEYNHGDLVWISWKEASGASTCGIGEIVEIRCVSEREY
jgi:hypothetical protein